MKLIGYGVCGPGEVDKYMEKAMKSFKICDEVVIVTNNATQAEKDLLDQYDYEHYEDNREWGKHQHEIKQRLIDDYISPKKPDWCLCMDMDEQIDPELTKANLKAMEQYGEALYVWIVDLWEDGYKPKRCFWNIRAYKWDKDRTQVKQSPLHCGLAPKWAYHHGIYSPFYHLHYGLKTKELRKKKIDRYSKYDPDADYINREYYDSLHEDNCQPLQLDEIKSKLIHEWETQNKPTIKKTKHMPKEQEEVYRVKRLKDGKELPINESNLDSVLSRTQPDGSKAFVKVGKWRGGEEKKEEKDTLTCPICARDDIKTKAGMTRHKNAKH